MWWVDSRALPIKSSSDDDNPELKHDFGVSYHSNIYVYFTSFSGVRCPTDVKSNGFRSQLEASRWSSHTEELWYNETVCLWMKIYIGSPTPVGWALLRVIAGCHVRWYAVALLKNWARQITNNVYVKNIRKKFLHLRREWRFHRRKMFDWGKVS